MAVGRHGRVLTTEPQDAVRSGGQLRPMHVLARPSEEHEQQAAAGDGAAEEGEGVEAAFHGGLASNLDRATAVAKRPGVTSMGRQTRTQGGRELVSRRPRSRRCRPAGADRPVRRSDAPRALARAIRKSSTSGSRGRPAASGGAVGIELAALGAAEIDFVLHGSSDHDADARASATADGFRLITVR